MGQLQREIRKGNCQSVQIDAVTHTDAKIFVVMHKNTLHYPKMIGGSNDEKYIKK